MALDGVKLTLLLLSGLGIWTLWGFPARNGLLKMLGELSEPAASVPGPTYVPMKQTYTGLRLVDKQLTTLVGFFYTAIDGNRADISVSFFNLGSQVLCAWILITIESFRAGNSGKLAITSITVFGILVAIVGWACVAPIWFVVHLWLSKTVVRPKDYDLVVNRPLRLAVAPVATLIGFGIPSAVMCLPAPKVLSFETKQAWTGIQQGWPIWIALAQAALTTILSVALPMASVLTEKDKKIKTIKYMRRAYLFAIACSASAHLAYFGLSLAALGLPKFFSQKYQQQLQPANLLIPPNPFGDKKAATLPDGALWFLQYDLFLGVTATFVWGVAVRLNAERHNADLSDWLSALVKYGLIATVLGPSGAAVVAIWTRDELVLNNMSRTE